MTHPRPAEVDPMLTGDTPPLDLTTIRATVRRALQERTALPPMREVRDLTTTLRGHLEEMRSDAEARRDALERTTVAWHRWNCVITRVESDLAASPGPQPWTAVTYMQILARTARHLADCLDEH
ncbi:DUF6415 family natural product biosynthesis protein [Streptomyces sp. CA-181903]|uniref:DUF6415 family natural product biosynthesis protein n=1 Tax=Streptomyces sp. CA-181903 TaxID=3240055 RepID=UPI003D92C521